MNRILKRHNGRILGIALALLASGFTRAAENQPPKFFSIVLLVRDGDHSLPPGHWANPEVNFDGLKTAFAMLDKTYESTAGPGAKFPAVIGLETDYAFDCHTRRGKSMGKTKADFFKAEQAALVPLEQGLFDHLAAG